MEDICIQGAGIYPSVTFKTNGEIKLEGRAMPENASNFFQPLLFWAKNIDTKEINIEFNLEYFNTSVSKYLLDLFREFSENKHIEKINILWMYEDGDDEMLESGKIFEEMLPDFQFEFKEYAEVTDW